MVHKRESRFFVKEIIQFTLVPVQTVLCGEGVEGKAIVSARYAVEGCLWTVSVT
jgi:hypothetical protein